MQGTCLTFLLGLTSNSEYPPTFVSELPIVVMGIGWTQAEQAEAVRAYLLRHPPPNSKSLRKLLLLVHHNLTIHRSCSGGIKGIACSGEFSYRCNAWRALSLSNFFDKSPTLLCRFESCFLHHFYTLQTSKKLSSRQGCPHPDGPVCWDGTVRGWVRVWQPQQPAV